jgi:hypothetical protein
MSDENREAIYDEHISPLMTQIIALCKAHDIPMIATFQINDDRPDGDAFMCTTSLPHKDCNPKIGEIYRLLYRRPELFAFTITTVTK